MTILTPNPDPCLGTSRVSQRAGAAAPAGGFTTMDLAAATLVDPNGLLDAGASTLGTTSTVAVNTGVQGLWDGGLDGLGFFFSLGALPALVIDNSGVILRLKIGSTAAPNPWRISLGFNAVAGAAAWGDGFMGGQLQGVCNARRDLIGGGGSSGSNMGANTGVFIDTFIQFNNVSTGNTGPEVRGILVTISDSAKTLSAGIGAGVNPTNTMTGTGYAVLGIGNTSAGPATSWVDIEASYQLIPRQP